MDGRELKRRRDQLGMSQTDLATALGVYQATISQWEQNNRGIRHPRMLALALWALEHGALGVEPRALLKGDGGDDG